MIEIKLPTDECEGVLQILARAPWQEANPLIMAIGDCSERPVSSEGTAQPGCRRRQTGRNCHPSVTASEVVNPPSAVSLVPFRLRSQ